MEKELNEEVAAFSTSIGEDFLLYPYDIWGSIAHCLGLGKVGLLTEGEAGAIVAGLRNVYHLFEEGKIDPSPFEDVHTLVEVTLRNAIGEVAGKLHTARSRNDQIVLDERLFLREKMSEMMVMILQLIRVLVEKARQYPHLVMPGYTHLQPAQPVLFAHHLLAYGFMLRRDVERLESTMKRVNTFPLGAGALAGTSLPIDRHYVAELLAFPEVQENSIDIVSDRDFILEFLGDLSLLALHLSRLGEELVLWSTPHFGFIDIDDAFTTGSSIMPQKKNPDVAELIRGKTGEVVASFLSLAMTLKALPLSYNRDLQQDKPPLLRAIREMEMILRITPLFLTHVYPKEEKMREALREGFLTATDFCEYLVEKGIPFRRAHALVGEIVRKLASEGRSLRELRREDFGEYGEFFTPELLERLDEEQSVTKKISWGSTSRKEVEREGNHLQTFLTEKENMITLWQETWRKSFRELLG